MKCLKLNSSREEISAIKEIIGEDMVIRKQFHVISSYDNNITETQLLKRTYFIRYLRDENFTASNEWINRLKYMNRKDIFIYRGINLNTTAMLYKLHTNFIVVTKFSRKLYSCYQL